MFGRIVRFRRGDKYEEMPGLDSLPLPGAHGGQPSASGTQGLVHRGHHTEPNEPSTNGPKTKIDTTPEGIIQ